MYLQLLILSTVRFFTHKFIFELTPKYENISLQLCMKKMDKLSSVLMWLLFATSLTGFSAAQ